MQVKKQVKERRNMHIILTIDQIGTKSSSSRLEAAKKGLDAVLIEQHFRPMGAISALIMFIRFMTSVDLLNPMNQFKLFGFFLLPRLYDLYLLV